MGYLKLTSHCTQKVVITVLFPESKTEKRTLKRKHILKPGKTVTLHYQDYFRGTGSIEIKTALNQCWKCNNRFLDNNSVEEDGICKICKGMPIDKPLRTY